MRTTITIRSRADIAGLAPRVLGFMPTESIVILAIGSGPCARADITASAAELTELLAGAARYWQRVAVVFYTDSQELFTSHAAALDAILPGVEIVDAFRISRGRTFSLGDTVGERYVGTDFSEQIHDPVLASRDELVARAKAVLDADEAEELAWAAYRTGDGAAAWCYLDRALELHGETSGMRELSTALKNAIDPNPGIGG